MLWKSISGLVVVAPPDSCSGKTAQQWEFLAEIFGPKLGEAMERALH